jgi:single-strand DNA-binding protein
MINRVIITGRLTKDVEVRKTQSGLSCANFTVACDRFRKKDDQEQSADFISCVAWRQSAEFLEKYAQKGTMIGVDGRIQTRSYENAQGAKVYVTEVVADNVQILETKKAAAPSSDRPRGTESYKTKDISTSPADIFNESDIEISSDDLPF